jgi:hypothetical protein
MLCQRWAYSFGNSRFKSTDVKKSRYFHIYELRTHNLCAPTTYSKSKKIYIRKKKKLGWRRWWVDGWGEIEGLSLRYQWSGIKEHDGKRGQWCVGVGWKGKLSLFKVLGQRCVLSHNCTIMYAKHTHKNCHIVTFMTIETWMILELNH